MLPRMPWTAFARALALAAALSLLLMAWSALRAGLPDDGVTTLAADAFAAATLLVLLAVGGAAFSAAPLAERLGLRRGRMDAGAIALAALGLLALSHALEAALGVLGAPPSATLTRFTGVLAGASPAGLALALVVFALVSAGAEELFFRGLVQRGLERRLGAAAAIAIASAAFAAAHGDLVHAAAALPLGAYLGVLVWRDGSLGPALAAHALNNAAAVLETGFELRLPAGAGGMASIGVGLAVAGGALRVALRRAAPGASASG